MDRRRWETIQHGCVSCYRASGKIVKPDLADLAAFDSTVAYKQAALNTIAYLMKVRLASGARHCRHR